LGHKSGVWGPIGALFALSGPGRSSRRVSETALGAVVGLAIGNGLIAAIGTGPVQVAVVTFLAMATATALGAEAGVVTQAGIASALIATIEPPHGLYNTVAVDRLIDILVGGAVAIAASALLRPNPLVSTETGAEPFFTELSGALEQVADALDAHDVGAAERALEQARDLDGYLQKFRNALELAEESVAFVPHYRNMRPAIARWRVADRPLEFAMRNVRVLARGAVRVIELEPQPLAALSRAVRELASAVRAVQRNLQGDLESSRTAATVVRAAWLATLVLEGGASMPVSSLVAQVRSATTDLLEALGLDHATAVAQVRQAADEVKGEGRPARGQAG
jgi:uncharacterized membrane protein YgaE (UPF0421/DUF939 family)